LLDTTNTNQLQIFDSEKTEEWPEWLKGKLAVKRRRAKEISGDLMLTHRDPFHYSEETSLVERNT
jgi:hypothetical protein